jgi:D-glycerate 3-kinase
MNAKIIPAIQRWSQGDRPTSEELQQLLEEELSDSQRANAFDLTRENGLEKIAARSRLFREVSEEVMQRCEQLGMGRSQTILTMLWQFWLPLAMQLAEARKQLERPLIQGILGGQGTGKTTLAEVSCLILRHLGYTTIGISIDDLYKTYAERQKLQQQDPRLIWRGPPGTHDVELGIQLLERIRQSDRRLEPILVPRFDKSLWNGAGDRIAAEPIDKVDIVLFEGWFVGARPVDETAFEHPPAPIVTPADRQFARDTNERLQDYLPLWERLDRLIILSPVDYRLSKQWRQEAEQKMKAAGKSGMSDEEIDRFVEYFWRSLHPELFVTPLTQNADLVDLVIEIDAEHRPDKVYKPITSKLTGQSGKGN